MKGEWHFKWSFQVIFHLLMPNNPSYKLSTKNENSQTGSNVLSRFVNLVFDLNSMCTS